MAFPYLTISSNLTNLNTASFLTNTDLITLNTSQSVDVFFGKSEKDIIEFSVYDISGNLISASMLPKNDTYSVLNGSYIDVDGNALSYAYNQYQSNYYINTDRNILLNTVKDLNTLGIPTGSNVLSYNCLRTMVGDSKNTIVIKDISNDRREIQLIPTFKVDTTNESNVLLNIYYEAFCKKLIVVRDIIDPVQIKLNTFNLNSTYVSASAKNPAAANLMKNIFGLTSDGDAVEFLNKIYLGFSKKYVSGNSSISSDAIQGTFTTISKYDGIKTYINNWMYTYYNSIVSVDNLKKQFQHIANTAVDTQLTVLNYNYSNIDSQKVVSSFIDSIFYDDFISPMLDDINSTYQDKFYSYLKNALTFGNTRHLPILNHSFVISDKTIILVVKLQDYLPEDINLRDVCWVSNISNVPILQKVIVNAPAIKVSYKISGPNFKIPVNQNYKSKPIEYKNKTDLNSSILNNQIEFNKKLQELNVDYTNFSEFIIFSSAQLRISLFKTKLLQLNSLNSTMQQLQISASGDNPAVNISYQYDINSINSQLQTIYNSFDGFESYMYLNSGSLFGDNYPSYLDSAIQYDYDNKDSLVNNTPEYLNSNDENSDYLVFLSMVGHFFDNICLYIKNYPTQQYAQNSQSGSYVSNMANILLENFGWSPIDSTEISDLQSYYLNDTVNTGSGALSDSVKMNTIWNRLLKNLPYLYKTKGTAESIYALANIYGIPSHLLNISEYGSNSESDDDGSTYIFDQKYYFTKFNKGEESISVPTGGEFKSIEFKFSFDSYKDYKKDDVIFLAKSDYIWIYVVKDLENQFGKVYFELDGQKINTESLPIFNGHYYNILLRTTPQVAGIADSPDFYTLKLVNVIEDRIVFESTAEMLLSNEYLAKFNSSGIVRFGNVDVNSNNFKGTLDKINVWNTQLSDTAFYDHCKNFDSYNDYDLTNTYQNLYFRYSVDYPVDLYSSSSVANFNKYYPTLSASCLNFTPNSSSIVNCVTRSVSAYPYQFKEIELPQNLSNQNLGPNVSKQPKINKVTQNAVARLMSNESSTTPIIVNNDSNLIGVYVSPYSIRNNDVLNFIGNYDLMGTIGDPSNLYKSSYSGLETIREDYNKNNLSEKVLYQEFFTLYKGYFDHSFFDSVKKLIPARSKLFTGILVESSVIERNKYENKPIESTNIEELEFTPSQALYNLGMSFAGYSSSSLNANTQKTASIGKNRETTAYISNDKTDERMSIFSENGVYYQYKHGIGFVTSTVYKENLNVYDINYFDVSLIDSDMYPKGHYSLLRNATSRKLIIDSGSYPGFLTTKENTVNQSGSLDGSSPITLTTVNVGGTLSTLVTL